LPTFSVIIPCYNRAGLIGQTLRSVLDGDVLPEELIVVDDGSTDGSQDEVKSFGDAVTLIEQENAGPGAARANGAEHATGEYLCFLDSDDLWFAWTLATYAQAIEQHGGPAFVTGKQMEFEGEPPTGASAQPPRFDHYPDFFASHARWCWWSASSFVVRRDAYERVSGFTRDWVNAEDCDLTMRLGVEPGFVSIESPATFAWRRHAGSAMSDTQRALAGAQRLVRQEKSGAFPGGAARRRERLAILSMHLRPAILDAVRHGNRGSALRLYRQTLGWHLRLGRWRFLLWFWKVFILG